MSIAYPYIITWIPIRNQNKQIKYKIMEFKFRTDEYSFSNVCGSSGVAGLSEPALGPDLQWLDRQAGS
jgi:hypothetical protein